VIDGPFLGEGEHPGGGVDSEDALGTFVDKDPAELTVTASEVDHYCIVERREKRQKSGLLDNLVDAGLGVAHRLIPGEELLVVVDVLHRHRHIVPAHSPISRLPGALCTRWLLVIGVLFASPSMLRDARESPKRHAAGVLKSDRLQRVPREVPGHGTAIEMCSPYTPPLSWDDAIR